MVDTPQFSKFVDRTQEVDLLDRQLEDLYRFKKVERPILEFYGIRGIGKSALLGKLQERCRFKRIPVGFIDFFRPKYKDPLNVLEDMARQLLPTLERFGFFWESLRHSEALRSQWTTEQQTQEYNGLVEEVTNAFVEAAAALAARDTVVLFFDTVEEAGAPVTHWLENSLIVQLSKCPMLLVILAGRTPIAWKTFAIRQKVYSQRLCALDKAATSEQMAGAFGQRLEDISDKVFDLTSGYPVGNLWLIEQIHESRQSPVKANDDMLRDLEASWLGRFVEKVLDCYLMSEVENRFKEILPWISPLRQFDASILREIVEAFLPVYKQDTGLSYVELLEQMIQGTKLITYDRTRKGYVLDPTVRMILSSYMQVTRKPDCIRLNEMVIMKYQSWLYEMMTADLNLIKYTLEILYHMGKLLVLQEKPPQIIERELWQILEEQLGRFYPENTEQGRFARLQLFNELQRDQEEEDGIPYVSSLVEAMTHL